MKIKTLAMIVVSALSLSSTAALADTTTVNGGTVHFKGEVVNAACAVDAGSIDQTVQLGQVAFRETGHGGEHQFGRRFQHPAG
ncbi:type 1 fimbriae major subunit FimA [Klebsiella pneumoniae]|nr:type 1 fimbriae major subunit FimA [Klebsiella pneumoniae]